MFSSESIRLTSPLGAPCRLNSGGLRLTIPIPGPLVPAFQLARSRDVHAMSQQQQGLDRCVKKMQELWQGRARLHVGPPGARATSKRARISPDKQPPIAGVHLPEDGDAAQHAGAAAGARRCRRAAAVAAFDSPLRARRDDVCAPRRACRRLSGRRTMPRWPARRSCGACWWPRPRARSRRR